MKKTCKIVGRDGKVNGRAGMASAVTKALKAYLDGSNKAAWNFAYGLCKDAIEAEELVQEACYRALKGSKNYKGSTPVKSWMFTIIHFAFVDSRRRKSRRDKLSLDWAVDGGKRFLHETLAEAGETVMRRLERAETVARTRRALARLGRKDREVLRLCDMRGLPYAAVARRLGVPEGTMKSRLVRARAKLRTMAVRLDL